jgi:tetratricopeptide (TPR) repeat protein
LAIEERLATLYSEMLDYPSALVHSCEMLHILEKTKPWCKQQIASIQNNIGWFYYKVGDLNNALISCQKSFELFRECFRSSNTNQINSELTYVLNSLGHIYLKSGDQTKALDYCQKSLQALEHENETGQHIKAFADNYELLADIYMQYGRQTLSFDYYLKALQLYQQLHVTKTDHSDIQRVLTSLKNINEIEF